MLNRLYIQCYVSMDFWSCCLLKKKCLTCICTYIQILFSGHVYNTIDCLKLTSRIYDIYNELHKPNMIKQCYWHIAMWYYRMIFVSIFRCLTLSYDNLVQDKYLFLLIHGKQPHNFWHDLFTAKHGTIVFHDIHQIMPILYNFRKN